jgi:lipoyl(octanoyl) transferase
MDKDCNQLLQQQQQQQQQQQYLSNTEILVEQLHRHITDTIHPVMAPNHVPIFRVERGGEVTVHGPSQLVIYPLLDLQQHGVYRQDLHWYLRQMETVVMETLVHFGITGATRDEINTGVWVHEKKVAAIGISASKWITTHGVALNVQPDLSYFDTSIILPCGIEGRQVTSMAELLMASTSNVTSGTVALPTMQEVAIVVAMKFGEVFNVETVVA